jgi:hypothetical protein
MIDRIVISGTCTGADGSGAITAYSPHVTGKVLAVHLSYVGDDAATTDVTLSDEGDPAAESIISRADTAADIKIYPRRVTEKNDGTDILYTTGEEVFEPYVVHGRLKLVVAQANTGDVITATVWLES